MVLWQKTLESNRYNSFNICYTHKYYVKRETESNNKIFINKWNEKGHLHYVEC